MCSHRLMKHNVASHLLPGQIDSFTQREYFTKEHQQLLKDGEKWMKNTAHSCMVVATLIATVVFGAGFTMPGGNDDKTGIPIFRQKTAFLAFVIADVAALVLSILSILTFLSILTSRYAEDDFLVSLPAKLVVGLVTLALSMTSMVAAFSSTFFIAYDETKWIAPWVITGMAFIPAVWFIMLHYKLVVDIVSSWWLRFSLTRRTRRLFQESSLCGCF